MITRQQDASRVAGVIRRRVCALDAGQLPRKWPSHDVGQTSQVRLCEADELDMDLTAYKPFGAKSVAAVLETFDGEVVKAKHAMASTLDKSATQR